MSKNFFIHSYLKKLYLCFALCFYALVKEGTVKWYFYFYTFGSNKVEKMITGTQSACTLKMWCINLLLPASVLVFDLFIIVFYCLFMQLEI